MYHVSARRARFAAVATLLAAVTSACSSDREPVAPAALTDSTSMAAIPVTPTAPAAAPASRYDIAVRFLTPASARQQEAFGRAVARWRQVVVGDLPDVALDSPANACSDGTPALKENVDDLVIFVRLDSIDGPGKVLGSAGPCYLRSGSGLTIVGTMTFDVADLAALETGGQLDDVILHEMGHVMGIGTLWARAKLVAGATTEDPTYTGAAAIGHFATAGGSGNVPLENQGGVGTRDAHWRESTMRRELMTGYISPAGLSNPLSAITVGTLADLGYGVSYGTADAYALPSLLMGGVAGAVDAEPRGRRIVEEKPEHDVLVWDARTGAGVPLDRWTGTFSPPAR